MTKRIMLLISSIVLALVLTAGVVYALFQSTTSQNLDMTFGNLNTAVTLEETGSATFTKVGDVRTINITIGSEPTSTASFGYEISILQDANNDDSFASSVLVYWDGEMLGTMASTFPGGEAFGAGTFVLAPERILSAGNSVEGTKIANHELKLEYNLGAGAIHSAKTVNLDIAVRASSLDVANATIVTTEYEFEQIMKLAASGKLAANYNVILGAEIELTKDYSTITPLVLNLNGYALKGGATGHVYFNAPAKSSVTSWRNYTNVSGQTKTLKLAQITNDVIVNNASEGWVDFSENVIVSAPSSSTTPAPLGMPQIFKKAEVIKLLKASAEKAILRGDNKSLFLGNGAYIGDNAGIVVTSDDSSIAIANGGAVTATPSLNSKNAILTIKSTTESSTVLVKVIGTAGSSAIRSALDTIMTTQLGTSSGLKQIAYSLLLPSYITVGQQSAQIDWVSSDPAIITTSGKFTNLEGGSIVDLVARIRVNNSVESCLYQANVETIKDDEEVLQEILDAYGDLRFSAIAEKHYLPGASSYNDASDEEKEKMTIIKALISKSKFVSFSYESSYDQNHDGTIQIDKMSISAKLLKATSVHRGTMTVKGVTINSQTALGSIDVYIDVVSAQEALKYLQNTVSTRTDVASNMLFDKFHNVYDDTGSPYMENGALPAGTTKLHGNTNIISGFTARDGSFVLPKEYSSASVMSTQSVVEPLAETKNIYYHFFYRLVSVSSRSGDTGKDYANVIRQGDGGQFVVGSTNTSAPGTYNNFFLIDPTALPSSDVTITIDVVVYLGDGSGIYKPQTDIETITVVLPGAVGNDVNGFSDESVFDSTMQQVHDKLNGTIEKNIPITFCSDPLASKIILNAHASRMSSLSFSGVQVTGSISGLIQFSNVTTLSMIGTPEKIFFATEDVELDATSVLGLLPKLNVLQMPYCGLSTLDFTQQLHSLTEFDCDGNVKIMDISPLLDLAGKLKSLNVSGTGLKITEALNGSDIKSSAGSILDIIYQKSWETHGNAPVIRYSYGASGSLTQAQYSTTKLTANQMKSLNGLLKLELMDSKIYDKGGGTPNKFAPPKDIAGDSTLHLFYSLLNPQSGHFGISSAMAMNSPLLDNPVYNSATKTWDTKSQPSPIYVGLYFVESVNAEDSNRVLRAIVANKDANGKDIVDSYYYRVITLSYYAL